MLYIIGILFLIGLWIYGVNKQGNEKKAKIDDWISRNGGIKSASLINKRPDPQHKWIVMCDFNVIAQNGSSSTISTAEGNELYEKLLSYCR